MGSQNAIATGGGKGSSASGRGPFCFGGGINEVRQYLLEADKPIPANTIRHDLGMSHERVYELLVRLEAQQQARVQYRGDKMAWVAL